MSDETQTLDVTNPEILNALGKLKTPEAKGDMLYRFAKQGVESLPQTLFEGADQAISQSFKKSEWQIGFKIARQTGKAEDLISMIKAIPKIDQGKELNEVPKEVSNFPGFPDKTWHYYDYSTKIWVASLKGEAINQLLIPTERYSEAVDITLSLGATSKAIDLAAAHLPPENVVAICERERVEFERGIVAMHKANRPDLESRLKTAHVTAAKNGELPHRKNDKYRWSRAVEIARQYDLQEEVTSIAKEGVAYLTRSFKADLVSWRFNLALKESSRYHPLVDHHRIEKEIETQKRLRENTDDVPEVIQIKNLTPIITEGDKVAITAKRDELYMICDEVRSPVDKFKVALDFNDPKTAAKIYFSAYELMHDDEIGNWATHAMLPHLDSLTQDEVKRYIYRINNKRNDAWQDQLRVAQKYGLEKWFLEEKEQNSPQEAVLIAINIGKKEKARELLIKRRDYDAALKLVDNKKEEIQVRMLKLEHNISTRSPQNSSLPEWDYHNKAKRARQRQEEIVELEKLVLGEARTVLFPAEFQIQFEKIVQAYFTSQDYMMGCLLCEAADTRVKAVSRLNLPEKLKEAETRSDFAGCFYLASRLYGSEEANAYRVLATQFNQEIYPTLGEYRLALKSQEEQLLIKQKEEDAKPRDPVPF